MPTPPHPTYIAVFLLRATAGWQRLPRIVRHLDMEAFTGRCSDAALFETGDPQAFYFLMEELRDTALFTEPYFEVADILLGLKDGCRAFESHAGNTT